MALVAQHRPDKEKRRLAEKYVEEVRKVESLGTIISHGINTITAFIIGKGEEKGAEEKHRLAQAYVEEERKVESLGTIISHGINTITAFIIDSREKKRAEERLGSGVDLHIKKLEAVYDSSISPLARKIVAEAIEDVKNIYASGVMEIERIYATSGKVEHKIASYKEVETTTIEQMEGAVAMARREIERIRSA